MCTARIIVYVTDGQVNWPVLIMASADRDSGLVAAKYNWNEHRSDRSRVFSNQVLRKKSDRNTDYEANLPLASNTNRPT